MHLGLTCIIDTPHYSNTFLDKRKLIDSTVIARQNVYNCEIFNVTIYISAFIAVRNRYVAKI